MMTPSTNSYCSCPTESTLGTCSNSLLSDSNCTNIHSIPPQSIKKLKKIFLCGKFSPINFSELQHSSTNQCPDDYKKCGEDTQQTLCYPKSDDCPINDIVISE